MTSYSIAAGPLQRGRAVAGDIDRERLPSQTTRDDIGQRRVVLREQYAHDLPPGSVVPNSTDRSDAETGASPVRAIASKRTANAELTVTYAILPPWGTGRGAHASRRAARRLASRVVTGDRRSALAGCGGSAKSSSSRKTIIAGQVDTGQADIKLPPGWKMTKDGPVRTVAAAKAARRHPAPTTATGDTVPLAKEDPTTKFFSALGIFQSCLKGLGTKFIGVPERARIPNSPANNPDYIKALSTCAAKSNIVKALQDQQTAQDNLTPAQIETQNKGYLVWRDCMIARGWGIPKPKPDAKGRLFAFGAGGGSSVPNFTPPPGQDILTSSDVQQCATESQQKVAPNSGG